MVKIFLTFFKLIPFHYRNIQVRMYEYRLEITFTIARETKRIRNKPIVTKSPIYGFTLIELLVTLCVLGIIIVIAVPSFRTMILNNRLTASTDALVNAFNYARSIALNNNSNIQVCPFSAPNSTTCGNNWSNGWIVVTQPISGTATLLKSQQNDRMGPTIGANVNSITFSAHGLASAQSNFTLCDARGRTYARSIEVMPTGFIQSGSNPGQAVWSNAALTCP